MYKRSTIFLWFLMTQDFLILLLVTILSLVLCYGLSIFVGVIRSKHNLPAPTMSGHPEVERAIRAHANTVEQLMIFLPSLWIFWYIVSPLWANILGAVWIVGRIIFAIGYYSAPLKRYYGFVPAIFASMILLFGSLIGIIGKLFGF